MQWKMEALKHPNINWQKNAVESDTFRVACLMMGSLCGETCQLYDYLDAKEGKHTLYINGKADRVPEM